VETPSDLAFADSSLSQQWVEISNDDPSLNSKTLPRSFPQANPSTEVWARNGQAEASVLELRSVANHPVKSNYGAT